MQLLVQIKLLMAEGRKVDLGLIYRILGVLTETENQCKKKCPSICEKRQN